MSIHHALRAIQTIRSNAWSSFPSCLSVNSISGQCQPRGPIMRRVFPVCDTKRHAEDSGGEITGFKHARKHTHTHTHSSSLFTWCKMPAPLNHRNNSPRSSGLRLSALPPEKETGSIYHQAAGWRNVAGAAAQGRGQGPRETNERQCAGVSFPLSPAAFTLWASVGVPAQLNVSTCTAVAAAGQRRSWVSAGHRNTALAKAKRWCNVFLGKLANVIMQDLLPRLWRVPLQSNSATVWINGMQQVA